MIPGRNISSTLLRQLSAIESLFGKLLIRADRIRLAGSHPIPATPLKSSVFIALELVKLLALK